MFEQFFDALAAVLNFFYTLVPEGLRPTLGFGVAIMGLTVLVMVLITPLTIKSSRSMIQMQRLQPEMKRLQEKHKDDREKLNQELMAFYRENQINPLGGCLPMLAQMPVFIIMYQLLRGLTERQGGGGTGTGRIIGQISSGATPQPWQFTEQTFAPNHLNPGTELYEALSSTNEMNFFGMDLSLSASEALSRGILISIPYLVLLLIILGTGLYQNRQMQARNTSGNVNPQQQMIMRFMPFFLPIFSFGFPAGLALYWCTQNFCRIGTNAYITHNLYKKEHENDAVIEATGKQKDSGKANKEVAPATDTTKGKGATSDGSGSNGSGASSSKRGASSEKRNERSPGRSVKSQMAHQKRSGKSPATASTGGRKSGSKVNSRRSGEARRDTGNQKKG
jgi:YidC/Oxa1 family membrane protein insertase